MKGEKKEKGIGIERRGSPPGKKAGVQNNGFTQTLTA